MYPLKFKAIFQSNIWGGDRIARYKHMPAQKGVGESWEVSAIPGNVSIVANGALKYKSLTEVLGLYKHRFIGRRDFTEFPLLVKFIDARDDLSIQVHPNDALARSRHHCLGKTELWYVVDAEPDAYVYLGFSQSITPDEYVTRVNDNTITEVLQKHYVKTGDVFYLPAGQIHAIGKGIFIAEIQQNSNITYRIFDYNRTDSDGNPRLLHTELAYEAIDFELKTDLVVNYDLQSNTPALLVACDYFVTNLLKIDREVQRDLMIKDSFLIYTCLSGEAILRDPNGVTEMLSAGDTILIPAEIANITLIPRGECTLLECYLPL